jgi:hypothetical protein
MQKILFTLLVLSLTTLSSLLAQETEGGTQRGIQIRAFAFALFENIDTIEFRQNDRILGEIKLPTGQLKKGISVKVREFSVGVTEGDEFRTLGNVKLPQTGRDFIIVFAPTKKGYRVFPVRTDDPEFRGNDTYLFNFSTRRLGIALGTAKQAVQPFKNAKLRPAFPSDATYYRALFAYESDGNYIPFNNSRWPVNSNTKALVFVYEEPSTQRLVYRSVTELAQ